MTDPYVIDRAYELSGDFLASEDLYKKAFATFIDAEKALEDASKKMHVAAKRYQEYKRDNGLRIYKFEEPDD